MTEYIIDFKEIDLSDIVVDGSAAGAFIFPGVRTISRGRSHCSISVTPDSLTKTVRTIAEIEKNLAGKKSVLHVTFSAGS